MSRRLFHTRIRKECQFSYSKPSTCYRVQIAHVFLLFLNCHNNHETSAFCTAKTCYRRFKSCCSPQCCHYCCKICKKQVRCLMIRRLARNNYPKLPRPSNWLVCHNFTYSSVWVWHYVNENEPDSTVGQLHFQPHYIPRVEPRTNEHVSQVEYWSGVYRHKYLTPVSLWIPPNFSLQKKIQSLSKRYITCWAICLRQ